MSTKGRRKIPIKRIDNEEARHVCFSKRRSGLFKKASDLATLCGAMSALVVYSPAGNAYSFGSPGVQEVVDRFLTGSEGPAGTGSRGASVVQEMSAQCSELSGQLHEEAAKKLVLMEVLNSMVEQNQAFEFAKDVEGLPQVELKQVNESLDLLSVRVDMRISEILLTGMASTSTSNVTMARANQFESAGYGQAPSAGPRFY